MRHLRLLISVIGIFASVFSSAIAHSQETSDEFSGTPGMVIVEPTNVISTEKDGDYLLVPYMERRPRWGVTVSIGYSSFAPVNYEPDFLTSDYSEIYDNPELPMIELRLAVKRNLPFGSIGGEFSVGAYENRSDVDIELIQSALSANPIHLGGLMSFDAMTPEPRFVPYFAGGLYTVMFRETADTRSVQGNTQVAPYVRGGLMIEIDQLDKRAARVAYQDSGIQASYVYIEGSKNFQSTAETDKDFSTDFNWGTGLRVEF